MSLFSTKNKIDNNDVELNINESYDIDSGLGRMLYEAELNDMAIFEGLFLQEMDEIHAVNEGVLQEELEAIQEASIGGIFKKIADFFRKLAEKIMAVVMSFIRKIGTIGTSNKQMITKYKKELNGKTFTKFKYKSREIKGCSIDISAIKSEYENEQKKYSMPLKSDVEVDDDDTELVLLNATLNKKASELSDYTKEAEEAWFGDEEEFEGFGVRSQIEKILEGSSTAVKDVEKGAKSIVDNAKTQVKHFDNEDKRLSREKSNDEAAKKYAVVQYKLATIYQKAVNKALKVSTDLTKKEIAIARAVYVKAIAFDPKLVKESAELEDFAYEAELAYDDMF